MSFNGSGTFVINSTGQPVVANTVISATTFNALTADLANGLTTCITKDGQTTPTANIPMGGFKITGLATGTAASDAATVAQIQSNGAALVTVTGTDTLTGSLTPALVAYVTGAVYYFVAPATNTGAVTLNIDTLGAKNVTRDGTTALVAGDIVSGEMVAVVYDGTRFQLISPVNSFTNLNVSGTLTVAGATTLNGNLAVGDAAADTINFKSSGWTLTNNVSVIGTWADIGTITTADINGGTIDGTTIGGGTAAAGTFTTATATTGNITTVNSTTVDTTNVQVTNLKAKDGTAAGSIANSTGVVTLNSVVATTADINGGTIDATTIGGSSPAVGNFTTVSAASAVFTTATITTVNTTTLDLTNLEVTNIKAKDGTASMVIDDATGKVNVTTVSAASMNAGVAAITALTATGASVASANVGTAVITNGTVTALTATGASIASMNAGVALLTTATVTNFTASGASIASANIGNLQFTAASIASINAGVAVINNLTATSASIASANVGVALITTGTVTALTATGASVASANVGTAVITGLTVTGASIASVNAGTATLSGNLTLSGGTANGVLYLNGSKVATSGSALTFNGTDVQVGSTSGSKIQFPRFSDNAAVLWVRSNSSANEIEIRNNSGSLENYLKVGNGYLSFGADTTEGMRLTSTGLGIGTSSPGYKVTALVASGTDVFFADANNQSYGGYRIRAGASGQQWAFRGGNTTMALTDATAGTDRLIIDTSGNLGLGVTPSAWFSTWKAFENSAGSIAANGASLFQIFQNAFVNTSGTYTYKNTSAATRYDQQSGVHAWYIAPSGTAGNAITFTQAMTLDASGNLALGATSASYRLDITAATSTNGVIAVRAGANQASYISLAGNASTPLSGSFDLLQDQTQAYIYQRANQPLVFGTNNTERARITSGGKLLVGTTTAGYGLFTAQRVTINPDSDGIVVAPLSQNLSAYTVQANNDTGTRYAMYIANGSSTAVGTVSFTSTATAYNTSSDYRLKNTIAPMTGALAKVALLKPCTYKWNADGSDGQGFIAHELAEVVPQCVTGDKDAVDAEGKPLYQGVDTSFLVATLTAAIQELTARVAQLESK